MRRTGPRGLDHALAAVADRARPQGLLARVQAAWPDAAGATVAAEASPRGERSGTIVVECSSGVWAQELELLAPDLLGRLNARLGDVGEGPVKGLRFRVGKPA